MNKVLILIGFVLLNFHVFAQESSGSREFYAAINPIAPFTGIPNQFTNLYLPLASNLETGLALNLGMISEKHNPEVRFSIIHSSCCGKFKVGTIFLFIPKRQIVSTLVDL